MSLVRTSALALCMMLAACVTAGPPKPEGIGGILKNANNQQQGKISIQESVFKKRSLNIEQERWLVKLHIRSDAYVTTECNIYLRVFDRDGAMLDEFLLFRVLDVLKPFPARRLEAVPGGLGVVLDDVVAGLYANVLIRIMLMVQGF